MNALWLRTADAHGAAGSSTQAIRGQGVKRTSFGWLALPLLILLLLSLLLGVSCNLGSQSTEGSFYDAGAANLSLTGAQFAQFALIRFDTTTSGYTLALPSAAGIVANLSSPYVGEVITLAVAADGSNPVTLTSGTNLTIRPSAVIVPANTTLTIYCEIDSVKSGSEAVTIY